MWLSGQLWGWVTWVQPAPSKRKESAVVYHYRGMSSFYQIITAFGRYKYIKCMSDRYCIVNKRNGNVVVPFIVSCWHTHRDLLPLVTKKNYLARFENMHGVSCKMQFTPGIRYLCSNHSYLLSKQFHGLQSIYSSNIEAYSFFPFWLLWQPGKALTSAILWVTYSLTTRGCLSKYKSWKDMKELKLEDLKQFQGNLILYSSIACGGGGCCPWLHYFYMYS